MAWRIASISSRSRCPRRPDRQLRLPMSSQDAAWLSAGEIVRLVNGQELDPQEVVRAHLDAIERLDPRIHAYIHVDRQAHSSATRSRHEAVPSVYGMPATGWLS